MPTLCQLQQLFSAALLEKDFGPACEQFTSLIHETDKLSKSERVSIYRKNARFGLMSVLKDTYPVCLKLVGEKYFNQISTNYISLYPSFGNDLNKYGDCFSEHLESIVSERSEAQSLTYLPDVARLEWYKLLSYYSMEDKQFDFNAFSQVPDESREEVVFSLTTSAHLLSSKYPVYSIWRANVEGEGEFGSIEDSPENVFIWRKNYIPQVEVVDSATWSVLSAFNSGITFGELVEQIDGTKADVDIDVILPKFIEQRWVTGFRLGADVS